MFKKSPILMCVLASTLAAPALAGNLADAVNLQASAPDMLLRSAAANCMANAEDLSVAAAAFKAAGWQGGDVDDGGLAQFTQDEVTADLNVDVGYCAVESTALTFADATAVASDLVTLDAGGKAVVEKDDEGCLDVSSDADPDNSLSISTAGQDATCKESPGAGVMITVLGGQD